MKKIRLVLTLISLMVGPVLADQGADKDQNPRGQTITVRGTLVDTDCYFEEGQEGNNHDGMVGCGKACLLSGVPAGVLVGDKVYILVFPSKAFADIVGKTVEITGAAYENILIHPEKAAVITKAGKKPIKLTGFEMM